jgi:hypothetical protein
MNDFTPNDHLPSVSASIANRTIHRLNRIGLQHFQGGRFPEASECFLSAMKVLKRTCSSIEERQDISNDDNNTLDLPDVYQEYTKKKTTRLDAILPPMNFCNLYLPLQWVSTVHCKEEVCSRYTLIGFLLIFNLASTIHHHALHFDDPCNSTTEPTVSRETLVARALQLYQCAFEGVSIHEYPTSSGLDKLFRSRQIVLGLQILLSAIHNMGLLLSSEEKRNSLIKDTEMSNVADNSNRDALPPSYRCFQVVFATLHSLSDYYGIEHSDFPLDFELQLVIDTALEGLHICESPRSGQVNDNNPWAIHSDTAPSA